MSEFAPTSEVRSELKWKLEPGKQHFAFALLRDRGFKNLHNARRVISLYYDDPNFAFFRQGEEGLVPRSKFRIRCYNHQSLLVKNARIEVKTTGVSGRTKYSIPYRPDAAIKIPWPMRTLYRKYQTGALMPVTLVSYQRRYFANDAGYRATVDIDIRYQRVFRFDGPRIITSPSVAEIGGVLELKTPMDLAPLEYAENLPLTRTRFSKYGQSLILTEAVGGLRFQRR